MNSPIINQNFLIQQQQVEQENNCTESLKKANILVADDDPLNRIIALNFLGRLGFNVYLAENGLQAYQANKMYNFDLILMDVHMPTMCGYESTQKIREYEQSLGKRTPIIALTTGDRDECLKAGMDEYLSKPAKFQQLDSMINSFLNNNNNTNNNKKISKLSTSSPNLLTSINHSISNNTESKNKNINNSNINSNINSKTTEQQDYNLKSISELPDQSSIENRLNQQNQSEQQQQQQQEPEHFRKLKQKNSTNDLILNNVIKSVKRSKSEPCFFSKKFK
ncbi:response regulator receiver domain-containing protein [Tieghemostelium lacteum]|uniref:Response regulator receiver domain-containing protein n=1 Tax=Tieghemostelium lacteum TaxID=361077 RepID=A0A151Z6S0_TIELA|nr:response regulator receiver domain-containing protein [Tieghemostelium lacteum]|eukprot:KYQ89656.1 response regulator receiver domain-containing protein [Tieghemostelium lacteum]